MRYLMEVLEADRERYPDLHPVYAFAGVQDGEGELERALWCAKGIEPLLYEAPGGSDHSALYDTLREWCSYANGPTAWRERRLSDLLGRDPLEASIDIDEVAELLRHKDAPERGGVLFVCGAGVSKQAGLPLFGELVTKVYNQLSESWLRHPAEREGMSVGGRMYGQYDRVLRCLERRLAGSNPETAQGMRERIQASSPRSRPLQAGTHF
jgi:hypothetical protein